MGSETRTFGFGIERVREAVVVAAAASGLTMRKRKRGGWRLSGPAIDLDVRAIQTARGVDLSVASGGISGFERLAFWVRVLTSGRTWNPLGQLQQQLEAQTSRDFVAEQVVLEATEQFFRGVHEALSGSNASSQR